MKKIVATLLNLALMVGMVSCGNQESQDSEISHTQAHMDTTNEEGNDGMNLLNEDELIKICGLTEDEYSGKDLGAFISFYKFTEENVKLYNIHNLLANFAERKNVESILNAVANVREGNFTQDIVCIAFVENKNTSINSLYIDVKNKHRWAYEGDYIFYDLNQYDYEDISDESIDLMLSGISDLGVFTLSDLVDSSEDISDPMSFTFVIKYSDGTIFRVERTGVPSKILPEYYNQWHDFMFS